MFDAPGPAAYYLERKPWNDDDRIPKSINWLDFKPLWLYTRNIKKQWPFPEQGLQLFSPPSPSGRSFDPNKDTRLAGLLLCHFPTAIVVEAAGPPELLHP